MKFFRYIPLCALIAVGITCGIHTARAAVISAYPDHRTIAEGETFTVDIRLNSEQQVVNAVTAVITYPKDLLDVVGVSRGGSFLTLWPVEPTIDSEDSTIMLTAGIPNGSYVVDGKIITITFMTKDVGGVEIGFNESSSSVLLNDGLGTPAALTLQSGIYRIDPIQYIVITSPTHPDENIWYRSREVAFEWPMVKNAEYSYDLSNSPDEVPDDTAERTTGKVTFEGVNDGIYYFILKEKQQGKSWAIIGKKRVQIDATVPDAIQAAVNQDNTVLVGQYYLTFAGTDNASGIDHYDVIENDTAYRGVSSPFILKQQNPDGWLSITAYDKAGNSTRWTHGTAPIQENSQNKYYLLIIAIVILGFFTAVLIKLRLRHIHNM
ncbi:MAG: cohesin domain-containing protein [Patescibacteria group bacterium]